MALADMFKRAEQKARDRAAGVRGANSDFAQGYLRDQLNGVTGRASPVAQAATIGPAAQVASDQQDQVRAQQMQQAGYLQGIVSGDRAGAGELAVNRQVGSATAAQQAAARMARGSNAALAARNAARNTADIGLAGAGQAAQAQMQDRQAASGQLAGVLSGIRGQDLGLAGQNAQLAQQHLLQQGAFNQQAGLANQGAQLQQTGMNDAASQAYLAQLMGLDQATWQRLMQQQQLQQQDKGMLGGLLQGAGQIATTYATGGFGGGPILGRQAAPMVGLPATPMPVSGPNYYQNAVDAGWAR